VTRPSGRPGVRSPRTSVGAAWHAPAAAVALALAAFGPTIGHGLVNWDDDQFVPGNALVASPDGLPRIWATRQLPPGYPNYPLVFTTFWLEYRLWGSRPAGYHATNVALHALNALLVWRLGAALGLGRAGAWLAAALFAAHPVQVESVAWVAQRKTVLSALFCLSSVLLFIRHRRNGSPVPYLAAIVCAALALLSKAAAATLPLTLLFTDRLQQGRWTHRGLLRIVPVAVLGAAFGLATLRLEPPPPVGLPVAARPLAAATALWFYGSKLVVPVNLLPVYPRWTISTASVLWWLPLAGVALLTLAGAWKRRMLVPLVWWGPGHFVGTLLPVLGFVPFGYLVHSLVADHFLYLACLGAFLPLGLLYERTVRSWRWPSALAAAGGLAALMTLTWHYGGVWHDARSLWTHTLAGNPACWLAHHNLGALLASQGKLEQAGRHYNRAIELGSRYPGTYLNLASLELRRGDLARAQERLERLLELHPDNAQAHNNLGLALADRGRLDDALRHYREAIHIDPSLAGAYANLGLALKRQGRYGEAVAVLLEGTRKAPPDAWVANNLAWLLATCPDDAVRNGPEAVPWARRALELAGRDDPHLMDTLAAALAEKGQFDEAVALLDRALTLAARSGDASLRSELGERRRLYASHQAFRESRP